MPKRFKSMKAPLIKVHEVGRLALGRVPSRRRDCSDLSQAAKDAARRSKSPLSPPLLRGETVLAPC